MDAALRGVLLATMGYGIISCADAAVKYVLPQVGVAGVMIWRGVVGSLAILAIAQFSPMGRSIWPKNTRLVFGRSALHAAVAVLWYYAWARGVGLADSYAVASLAPIFMTLMAVPLLGERIGWRRALACGVGFAGALVMLQPGGALWRWEAALLVVAVVGMALSRTWTRVLARTDNAATISFWLMLAHLPLGVALLPFFPAPVTLFPLEWGALLALVAFGCANAVAHMLFARAFALAPVGAIAPLEYSVLPWGVFLGWLIFSEIPGASTIYGAVIVMGAGFYAMHRERVRARERARLAPAS